MAPFAARRNVTLRDEQVRPGNVDQRVEVMAVRMCPRHPFDEHASVRRQHTAPFRDDRFVFDYCSIASKHEMVSIEASDRGIDFGWPSMNVTRPLSSPLSSLAPASVMLSGLKTITTTLPAPDCAIACAKSPRGNGSRARGGLGSRVDRRKQRIL